MSVDYAAGLSQCDDLGLCGLDEINDEIKVVHDKIKQLAQLLALYKGSCVVHVGAGLSTAAGIRDFRGKHGVWTELLRPPSKIEPQNEAKQEIEECPPKLCMKPFDETEPTVGHMVLKALCKGGYVRHIVSQNVDGLFLKADLARCFISELHGNFYLDECTKCRSRYVRPTASPTMKLTKSSVRCPRGVDVCKGSLRDTILDWHSPIPFNELQIATRESRNSKLHVCIGTTMQLSPSKDIVCNPRRNKSSKLVIVNLQPTQMDDRADIVIHYYADYVLRELAKLLELEVEGYSRSRDPTRDAARVGARWLKG